MTTLSLQVSCFDRISNTSSPITATVEQLLICIWNGGKTLGQQVMQLRAEQDSTARKALKQQLPVAMWQGTFSVRSNRGFQSMSSLMCIDIDHKPQAELDMLRQRLAQEPWVFAYFTSPSGDGLKVIVKTDLYDINSYSNCYLQLEDLFQRRYGIMPDPSCAALSQACFLSYDPNLFVNPNVTDWNFIYDPAFDKVVSNTSSGVRNTSTGQSFTPIMTTANNFMNKLNVAANGLSDDQIIAILDRKYSRYPQNYQDGNRTKSIFCQSIEMCKAGILEAEAITYLESKFLPTGYVAAKLHNEVHSAYQKNRPVFGSERGNYKSYQNYLASKTTVKKN